MPRMFLYALLLGMCMFSSPTRAQGVLAEVYGKGVHKFFAGDLVGANELFTEVINNGSEDPRAYFFRGLVQEVQGGGGEADFEQGARMEAEGRMAVDVGFALSRIQGHTRSKIETARRDARVLAQQQSLLDQRARLDAAGTTPPAAKPVDPAAPVAPTPAVSDPFGDDAAMRSGNVTVDPVQPTPPEVDAVTNPFGDDPPAVAPTTPAAPATDPFGNPATPPPPATGVDPFGTPAGPDPFGN